VSMGRSSESLTNKELLNGFVRGDEESFNVLVQRQKLRLFNLAYRVLYDRQSAEDVVQKVLIRLAERKDDLRKVRSVQAWLYAATLNLSLDMQKRMRRRKEREKVAGNSSRPESPREVAMRSELRKELDLALAGLRNSLRIPLILRYLQGLSYEETGEVMGLSSEAVRKRVKRGLRALRTLLKARKLVLPLAGIKEVLRATPSKAASADFLGSASSIIKAASTAGISAKAAVTTASLIKGGLIMTAKSKIAVGIGAAVLVALVVILSQRPDRPSQARREEGLASGGKPGLVRIAKKEASAQEPDEAEPVELPSRFGVLVWPGMSSRALSYSRTMLSWMKGWGYECNHVVIQEDEAKKEPAVTVCADLKAKVLSPSDAAAKIGAIVTPDGRLPATEAAPLRRYLLSGGWLIMPSPEKGSLSPHVEELLQLQPGGTATLMAPKSVFSSDYVGPQGARLLVSHPSVSGTAVGQWLEWAGPSGTVLYSKADEALPLLCFRRPELPAVRLVPFARGGVVHWNFALQPGPLIQETDLKAFLRKTIAWLSDRPNWVVPLEKEALVSGIVRVKEGAVVPGAKATAAVFSDWGEPVRYFEATSSGEGKFSFPALDSAMYWVKAEAEGYYQIDSYLLCRARQEETSQIEVLMEPEGSIFGHAYYGPGEDHPAVGITVTLAPNCRMSSALTNETITDQNARFCFDNLPSAQTFYLIAKREGWLGMREAPLPLDGGSLEVDLHLDTPVGVEGTTINAATGEPLGGVGVLARPSPGEGSRFLFADALAQTTTSGEDGNFRLNLLAGSWRLTGEAPGFTAIPRSGVFLSENGAVRPCEIVVKLFPHAALYGTVFNSSGEPAPQAKVTAEPAFEHWTDEQARYRTDPVAPSLMPGEDNVGFKVCAEWQDESGSAVARFRLEKEGDPGPSDAWTKSFADLLQGEAPLDIHLKSPEPELGRAMITGIVLGENAEPVPFVTVELADTRASWVALSAGVVKSVVSDSEGKFAFSQVREGLWLIRARKKVTDTDGKVRLYWGEKWQQVDEDVPVPPLELRLGKAYIHGRILNADGTPVRDRCVTFFFKFHTGGETWQHPYLGERGEFSLFPFQYTVLTRPPSTEAYMQRVRKKWKWLLEGAGMKASVPWEKEDLPLAGYVNLHITIDRGSGVKARRTDLGDARWGEESLIVSLPPYGRVRGQVIDADSGRPIAKASIGASQQDSYLASCMADEQGMFSFPNLPAGRCVVGIQKDGYWIRRKEIGVVEEQEVYVQLEIWTYFIIRGRLLVKDTAEPLVAEIHLAYMDGRCVSGRDGRFALPVSWEPGYPRCFTLAVYLEGTGLKSVRNEVRYNPWVREIDVGDIYVESEEKDSQDGEETFGEEASP